MFRTMLLASSLALGLTGAALAQGGPRMVGGGPDAQVVYDAPVGNVVGGGAATIVGGANDQRLVYGGGLTTIAPNGMVAEITGEAGNRHVVYRPVDQANDAGLYAGSARDHRG